MDPDEQVAGYAIRSASGSYLLNTARVLPEAGSTNGPATLAPGTTYHFIISVSRAPRPGESEDELPVADQYTGTFDTRR